MTLIQILLIAFAAFALLRVVQRYRRGGMPALHFLLWSVFWIAVGVVVIRPETTSMLARFAGVGRGADVVVYLALAGAFYLLFRLFVRLEELEREITKLVRSDALKDIDEETHG